MCNLYFIKDLITPEKPAALDLHQSMQEHRDWIDAEPRRTRDIIIRILDSAAMRTKNLEEVSVEIAQILVQQGYNGIPARFYADWLWIAPKRDHYALEMNNGVERTHRDEW